MLKYLSGLMAQAAEAKKIELFTMRGTLIESHLAFVDDVIFFCRASTKSCKGLKEVLEEFTVYSSHEMNCTNSFVVCLTRVEDKDTISEILSFSCKCLSFNYHGVPFIGRCICHLDYTRLIIVLSGIIDTLGKQGFIIFR